ncbi:MAG TPA: hypothetical protein VHI72_15740 [Hyphomicrobiaceae bacterium]|nr:hypothetical protein [Hyphomicrobiaceae bacterium]
MGYDRRGFVLGLGAAGALIGLSLPALAAQGIQPRLVTMQALVVGPTLKSDLNSPELDASIPFRFRLEPGVKMIQWREARVLEPALPEVDLLTLEGAAELCRENLNGHDAPTIQFTGWVHPKLLSRVDKSKPVRVAVPIASAFLTFDMIEIH